jgi:PKD repeat protein
MKKLILTILLLTFTINAQSAYVPLQTAQKAALNWFNQNQENKSRTRSKSAASSIKDVYIQQKNETNTLFIFNMNPTGFVVVAADDTVDPILAYSFDSELVQDNINPAAKEWIDNYSEQISNVIATQPKNGEKIGAWSTLTSESFNIETAALDVPAMPPLLSTKWDVFADYNLFSPGIGSVKTDTGEMALTMAQVLRYWKYPESGIGEYSYTPRCIPELGKQSANFHDTIYDYSKMPDQLTAESTPEEISAVAELIYHCGVSVETNYLMVGSSAAIWDGFDALIKYFDYSMTSMKLLYKTGYSDDEWKNILYNELDNHRVIIYQSCRKFICDGYQGTEFFHFSFCWGGDGNGYYRLDTIDPNEDHAFTGIHTIIAGIQPNNTYETQTILAENFDNTFPPNGWSITIVNDTSPSPQWSQVNSGTNPTCSPYSGTNMIAFNSNTCPSGAEARLVLPDIDLTAKDYAKLIFYMYQDTGETDKTNEGATFQLSEDGSNWQNLKFIPRYTLSSGWHEYRIDLTYYKGKTIKIGILGHSEGGNNIYLDHLTIQYVVPGSFFTSDRLVSYTGAPVSFEDTSFRPTSWLWDFGDGETSTQQHPTHSYASSGQYTVTLSINNGSSVNRKKDYILILPTFTPPYTPANGGDFESNALHFMSQNLEGGFNLWESGQPSNVISDTTSGTTVWKTDLDANIVSDRDYVCALYSPLFDLDIIGTYYLKFNQRMDAFGASYDIRTGAAWIEYSLDRGQTWQKLGDTSGNPAGTQNWYNIDGNEVLESSCWWQKTSTYIQSIYNITEFSGQSDIAFRFVYKIQNSPYAFYDIDGWAIDDFEIIYEPPTAIFTADKLVSYAGSPIAFTEQSTFAMTWLWDFGDGTTSTSQHITHTYQTPGQYTVTLNINNGGSVATHVYTILPAIKPSYTLENGGNFETNLTDFFSYATSGDINVWELGQPSHTINNTASGRNVWKTDLDANFIKGDYTNALCTPIFSFSDPGKYYLKFQFRMDTYYSNAPGAGWLEYSTDEGLTWQKLGSKTDNPEGTQNWYNTTQSSVIDYGEACWWIRVFTSDYIQAIYNLTEFSGQSTIAFRFMFKVKGTLNDALYNVDGWAIDDFQIAFTPEKAEIGSTTQISSVGQPIQFKDQSVFVTDSTSWSWEFPGGIPSCSTAQNPTVVYQSPGSYAVYLTSCDASGYCLTETKQSYMTIYESITTACETTAVDSGNYIGVKNFDFNTIHNSTGSADTDGGNLDFTSSIVTTLSANTSYSVSVYGDNNVRYVKIFIDYNNDGDFEDTDEVVYNASGSETFIGTITTPANPIFDEILTMRVIARYNTITDPCTINLNYGQAEDYGVVFVSGHNKIRLTQAATSLYSDGLIIEDINFIKDTGDLIAIANNDSQTTWTTRDVGTGLKRWDRIWQIDFDDINSNGGAVKFIFDFSDGGFEELSYNNATTWYLYKRQGESGDFIKDIPASAVSGDQVIFDAIHVNDLSDHFYYTLEAEAILEISDITEQATGIGSPKNMTFTVRDTNSTALSISAQTSDLTVSVNNICFSVISGGSMISEGNAYTLNKTEELAVISAIITPTGSLVGVVDLTITVSDGTYRVYDLFKLDIVDHPPEISNMLDHVTGVDKAISIPFTISDTDSHVFRLTAQSSNQIVTEDNISFGILSGGTIISSGNIYTVMQNASLANVFLEITPTQGAMGETSLTLTISDMSNHIVHSFKLLVFDFPPEISDIKNAFTDFETAISIPFKISDTDSDILTLTAITSNHIATPENISFGILSLGSIISNGNQYTLIKNGICADVFVEITPSQGAMGETCLTLTVADLTNAPDDSDSFKLKVINYPPKISSIPDIITSFETSSSSYFSVSDTDTDTLIIEAASSGPSVRVDNISFVPLANCIIIKDGSTYTISKTQDLADIAVYITPTAGQSGPVLITVTVSDGMNLTQSMSVFSVYIAQEGESLQIGEPFITSVDDQFGPNSPLTLYGAWPQIIGIANADGSIDIAWYDDTTKKTYLTQVDRNYVIRRNIDVTLLDQFAGFTKDNSGNYYLLSAVEENIRYSATPSNENRSNIVKLMKLDKFGNKIYEADLKDAGDPIYQPLSGGSSRIEYGNGVIYVLFSRLTEFATDINTRHQKASYRIIDAETGSVSTTMPVGFSHSFDQRLYFDGDYILSLELGDVYSRAVGLAKHDTSDRLGSMQDIFTIKGGMNSYPATGGGYNNTFTRLGNVRKGNTSYLVAMITETDGIHFGLHILLDARNVAIINVVHNFENNFAYAANPDAETFVSYYNTGYDNPYGSKLRWITHYLDENTENAERIKLEKVGPDRFVVLWEKWTSDTYVETYGTVIDELGNVLVPEKALNKARLNRGDDIFLLDNKAAWIEGLADRFLLHIVDDTDLSLTTRQIVFTDDPPVTAFTSSSRIGFMGTAIRFFDQSEISPSHWQWSFPGGDPVLSNSQNPTVTYNLPGTYPVALTASNTVGTGSKHIQLDYITIYPAPAYVCFASVLVNSSNRMGIKTIDFNTIHNSTGDAYEDGGYVDFTTSHITALSLNTTYTFAVTSTNINYVKIFINYNNDNDFDDTNELIYEGDVNEGIVTGSMTTPVDPVTDVILTMRVIGAYHSIDTACPINLNYGQVEDYGIVFQSPENKVNLSYDFRHIHSGGLIIKDKTFLKETEDYISAWHNGVLPAWTTSNMPPGFKGWEKVWQLNVNDINTNGGNVELIFDFQEAGFDENVTGTTSNYFLLSRQGVNDDFKVILPASSLGSVVFDTVNVDMLQSGTYFTLGYSDNTAPHITSVQRATITINTSEPIPFTVSDAQGGDITITAVSNNENVTIININGSITGSYTFTASPGLDHALTMLVKCCAQFENAQVTMTAVDSTGLTTSCLINIILETTGNDTPIISDIFDQSRPEGHPYSMIHLDDFVFDPDNTVDELIWTAENAENFTITIDTNRNAMITPKDPDWNGSEIITFIVKDPGNLTASDIAAFTVTAINDVPVVSDISDQTISEDTSFAPIHLDNFVSDIEDAYSQINWTATGQTDLTITITDRVVTIEAADNWYGSETITFIAEDTEGLTSCDTAIFTVTSVNDAPVISDVGDQTIDEDFSFTSISLDQYISDIEDSDSQITWTVTGNSELAVTITDRIVTIKASANWSGAETITFMAEDTGGLTASDSAIFTVNSVNDAPVISGIIDQTVNEDTSFTAINLDDCVVDIEDADSQISWAVSGNSDLTVTISNRIAVIESPANWNGSETVIFKATDTEGLTATHAATFTVIAVNDPPVFSEIPDQSQAEGNSFTVIHLDDYVFDIDNNDDSITWMAENQNHLTITINSNREATIEAKDPDWNGSETIKFMATAPDNVTSVDYVVFTVTAVNDAPVISDIIDQTVLEDTSFTIINLDDHILDVDNTDDEMSWTYAGQSDLTVTITNRIATIEAPENWYGTETITFTAQDKAGLTASDAVIFTITSVNDIPVVSDISDQTILEDSTFATIHLDNFVSDIEDAYSQINWTATGQTDLTITITDRVVTIEAADNWYGTETITFIAQDSEGLTSSDTAIFTVTSVNDAPVISDIGDQTVDEDCLFTSISLDQFISDIEDLDSQITWTVTGNSELAVTITDRIVTIKASANWSGTETITFMAKDTGGLTASDAAIFTVNSVNDAPAILYLTDKRILENDSFPTIHLDDYVVDVDHTDDEISWTVSGQSDLTVTITNRIATIEAPENWKGTETITFTAQDTGGLTTSQAVTFSIIGAPDIADIPDQTVPEDTPFAPINLDDFVDDINYSDSEINWSVTGQSALSISITNRVATIEAPENWNGTESLIFIAEVANVWVGGDSNGLVSWTSASFTMIAVNDPPSFTMGQNISVPEDSSTMFFNYWATNISPGASNEKDACHFEMAIDHTDLFSVIPTLNSNGTLKFTPKANVSGVATVDVILKDNGGTENGGNDISAAQSFKITITEINDPPSFTIGPNQRVNNNKGIVQHVANWATNISAGPPNEDQSQLRFQTIVENDSLLEGSQNGIFISNSGDLTYTPTANANGTITVTVILEDGGTGTYTSGEQRFTITLKTTNQAPSFVKGSNVTIDEDEAPTITIQSWATNISPGAANEMNQQLEFYLSPNNSGLFAIPPKIIIDNGQVGHLFFAPAKNAFGSTTVSVYLKDNAGTAFGGVDTSATQEFTITINPVNDPPTFLKGVNIMIIQDYNLSLNNWARSISAGPANETGQSLTFHTSAVPETLFVNQPQVSSTGTLTFRTSNQAGIATVSVYLMDNGTGNNTSATETFAITIKPTSAPELSEIEDYEIMQDTQTENISIVVTDEDTPLNNITVTATSSNTDLVNTNNLAVSKMASLWRLSITPITGQSGVTTITVTADDGSQTTSETFNLTVHGIPSAQVGVASDNYSETAGTVPMFVHFSPANIQNENDITGWLWDFGDGKTSTEKSPVHTFYLDDDLNDPSLYTVRLTVYGFNGSSSTDTKTNYITLYSFKYANFFAMNTIGPEDLRVNFYSQCIGFGSSATFQWNFGDGSMSTLENPIHTYTETGIYTVSLAASNGSFTRTMSKPDFVKVTGRSISGQITASDTTLGIENCLVEIWSVANNVLLGYTHTASDGSYSIKELPSLEHIIIGAWPPLSLRNQYDKTYYDGADNRSDATKVSTLTSNLTDQNMTLEKIPETGIRGRILDTDGITGIANIEVDVFSHHFQTGNSATTDAEGFYTVTGLQNASDYIVSTWSEHLNMEFFYAKTGTVLISKHATKIELANEYVDNITITVLPTGRISGHVSANGQALANIKISAWSDMLGIGNKALTNEMGDYTISGLISQSNAANITYIVECRSPDYPYQAYNTVSERHLASPVTTGRTDIDFTIKTGNDIKGTVTDAHNNVLSGVSISAWSESKKVKGEAISQSSGEYTLSNMPPAPDYKIIATSVDYPVQYYNQQKLSEHAEYVDNTNGDVDHIDFFLDKGGMIKGYVKLENDFTAAGSGIWVNIWSKSTQTGGDVVTDINGMYEITGLEKTVSDYKISIYHDSCMPSFYNASETVYEFQDAESVAPSPTEYRNIVLKSGFTVTGKMINAEGTAVSGIKIEAFSEETNGWGEATSTGILENDANYIIKGLIPGTYNITISPDNYISETKSIVVDDDISNVDFILIAPDRKISGTITGLDLNKEISLTASSEQLNDSRVISIKGTGNNVDYEITGLKPAADYRVDLRSSDYPYQVYNGKTDWDQANEIDLTNSDSSGINFTLESADLSISGILSFPTQTYEHVWVEASSKALNFTKGVHINYTGSNPVSYQIEGLMKGAYIVSIWPALSKSQYYNDSDTEKNAQAVDLNAGSQTNINFTLKTGAFVEGHVYEADGTPASSVKVQANSKNSDSWGLAQTNGNGFYRIEGLDTVNDFIVQAQKTGLAALYFNSEGAVMDQSAAEMVRANSSNINMRFVVVESISGIVRNINGQRIESSVRVIAKSEVNQIETSVYTTYIGTYKIDGLIPGNDYKVTAVPHASSPYMSQTKTNISTNSTDINFMLEKGHSIEGSVSSQNTVIRNVKIEVLSVEADFYAFAKTDINGHYEISGLKSATDYAITATPPEESAYRVSITDNIEINTDYIFNIVLNSAYTISGHIYEADGTTPVPALRVTVFSSDQNFMSGATTDETGYYRVENIPDASDFIVTASPTNFAQQKRIDQASGSTVDFILSSGGTISGAVNTAYGPFENATVEVFSETVNISKSDTTDINGNYQITGLHNYWNGILVSDYVVTVYASGYPNESKGQKSVGDIVNFTLTKGEENELSGIIKDSTGVLLPSDSETVWIKVYLDGVYQTKTKVKKDGTGAFTVKGLQPNTNYTLQVSNSTKSEWIGSDGIGVSENADAAFFTTSDTVDFSFGVEKTYHPPTVMTGSLTKTGSDYKVLYLVSTTDDTPVTMRGVCWDYYSEPTTDTNCTHDGTGTGRYESVLENLPYKYIYFRAYATNAGGTAYGNQKSIQMTCESGYTLKAKNPESGGKIEIFPDKDGCYRQNVHVTIKAIPDACYRFTGWSGDCSGTDLCGLVMTSEKTATPSFERLGYTVTVSAQHGTVSPQMNQATYDCGTSISLAVTPNAGYRFDHWEGGLENQGATVTILVDQPLNVSAICVPTTQNRSISGYVQDVFGRGVANASIFFSETGDTVNTNASGFYSYTLTQGNSVTAIPEMTGCTFSPPNRSYDNVASSINAQNYTITTVTSLQPGLRVWIDKNANAAYDNGEEVSGAEIYMNGAVNPYGTTDSQGVIGIINLRDNDHIHATKTFYAYVSPKADDAYFDNDRLQNPYYATTENWSMNGSNYVFTMDSDIRMADGAYQEFPGANQSLTSAPKDAQGNILVQLIHPFIKWNLVVAISDQLITDAWQQKIRIGLQGGNRILYNYTDGYFIIKNMVLILGGEMDSPQFEMANIHITYGMPLATTYVLGYRYTKPNRVITLGSMWSAYTPEDITWWSVFAHELGHYLVGVYDEYYNGKGDSNTAWAYRQSHNGGSGEPNEFPSYYGIMDNSILAEELSDVTDYYPHDYTQKDVVSSHYSKTQGQSCWETFKSAYTEEIKTQMQANGYTGFSDDFFEGLIVPPHTTGSYPESDRSKRPGPIMVHERDELNFIEW